MYFPSFSYSVNVFLSLCFHIFSLSKCFYALKIEILLLILYTGKQHIPITFCPKWLETAQPMRQILILNPERKEIQRMWELGTDYHWFINQWESEREKLNQLNKSKFFSEIFGSWNQTNKKRFLTTVRKQEDLSRVRVVLIKNFLISFKVYTKREFPV